MNRKSIPKAEIYPDVQTTAVHSAKEQSGKTVTPKGEIKGVMEQVACELGPGR